MNYSYGDDEDTAEMVTTTVETELPDDYEALRQVFIAEGGNPGTKRFQAAEMRAQDKAHIEVNQAIKRQQENMHPLSRFARDFIMRGMEFIAMIFTVLLVLGGMLIGSVLLIMAEIAAVSKGFAVIESSPLLSVLYACTTVFFFLTVLFIREIIAHKQQAEPQPVLSMRLMMQRVLYFLGIRRDWRVMYKDRKPILLQVDSAVTWLMWTIVLFGLLGRLSERMAGLTGNWMDGLRAIAMQSTLQEMTALVGALVMTVALLLATHFIVYFVHMLYVRMTGGGVDVAVNFSDSFSIDTVIERERVSLLKTEILRLRAKNGTT